MMLPPEGPKLKTFEHLLINPYNQTYSTRTSEFLVQLEQFGQSHVAFMAEAPRGKEPEPVVFFELTLGGMLRPVVIP